MKARGIGSLLGVVMALSAANGARAAFADAPPSLWDTIRTADAIVLARVVDRNPPPPPPAAQLGAASSEGSGRTEEVVTVGVAVTNVSHAETESEDTDVEAPESERDDDEETAEDDEETDVKDEADDGADAATIQVTFASAAALWNYVPEHLVAHLQLEIQETWKGSRLETLEMRLPRWNLEETGCTPGQTVVAFYKLSDEEAPVICLFGEQDPRPGFFSNLRKQIRRAVSIQAKGAAGLADELDWLVDQVAVPETAQQALYELYPAGDRESYAEEPCLRRPLAPLLTPSQIDRIERAFVRRKAVDGSLPIFLLVLMDRPSRAIDDAAIVAIEKALATQPYAPDWLRDAVGLELERFGDADGRLRRLLPDYADLDAITELRAVWESARRELGIPSPRASTATGPEGCPPPGVQGR